MVEYIKVTEEKREIDCILKYEKNLNKISNNSYELVYDLSLVLLKDDKEYIQPQNRTRCLISSLKVSLDKRVDAIDFVGSKGKNFLLENFQEFNFRGLGIFPYLAATILKDAIALLDDTSKNFLYFPDSRLSYVKEFEQDEDNYLRRNQAYRKLNINFEVDSSGMNGMLLDTPVDQLTLDIKKPDCFYSYEKGLELINDIQNLVPFAKKRIEMKDSYMASYFSTKITTIKNATFDVRKVIGTDHSKYANDTWIGALNNLRSPSYIEDLSLNPKQEYGSINFYNQEKNYKASDDPWGIYVFNDKSYITEGNHRTIISKFLHATGLSDENMTGLKYVIYHEVDENAIRKFLALKRWLKIFYPMFHFDIRLRNQTTERLVRGYEEIEKQKVIYEIYLHKSLVKIDGKLREVQNIIATDTISKLKKILLLQMEEDRSVFAFKLQYMMLKIQYAMKRRCVKYPFLTSIFCA